MNYGYNNLYRQIMCKQEKRKIVHAGVMMLLWNWSLIQNPQISLVRVGARVK